MRTLSLVVFLFPLLTLTACNSIQSKRVDYKSGSGQVAPLEVPPELTSPEASDRYAIPEGGAEGVAVYSDYKKQPEDSKQVATVQPAPLSNVLPDTQVAQMERSGSQRWLVVSDRAENVWPVIKEFWLENGFTLLSENPEAGLMETDWLENSAKIPQGKIRNVLGKVFSKVYSSNERDKYRTRLERSKEGDSTEIYISHTAMQKIQNSDQNGFKWQLRGQNPEMEAGMLQLLMAKLVGKASAPSGGTAAESTPESLDAPQLQEVAGGDKKIVLSEPFDKSWRKVGLALEQAGIVVSDKDRATGVYFITASQPVQKKSLPERLKFWRIDNVANESKGSTRYQVVVRENNGVSDVNVLDMQGATDSTSQRIMQTLYEQLIK